LVVLLAGLLSALLPFPLSVLRLFHNYFASTVALAFLAGAPAAVSAVLAAAVGMYSCDF
jgi:hypothetical protein